MKQVFLCLATMLVGVGFVAAQATSGGKSGATPPAGGQSQAAPQAQAAPPVKGIKAPPQAKTQDEYNDFSKALNATQGTDETAAEAGAREFQAKYPQSELTSQLYLTLMFKNLQANNAERAIDMGREVLKLEPNNPVAAIYSATALAETTRDSDIDAAQKFDEAIKEANIGIQNVDSNLLMAANVTQEQADATKADLKARAYDALGLVELKRKNDAAAVDNLQQSIKVRGEPGDPMTHLRLALAFDHLTKYNDAMTEANKAASLASPQQSVSKLAQAEIERLKKLTGSGSPTPAPANPPAPASAPPSLPKP